MKDDNFVLGEEMFNKYAFNGNTWGNTLNYIL